jgi:hypothetical protein
MHSNFENLSIPLYIQVHPSHLQLLQYLQNFLSLCVALNSFQFLISSWRKQDHFDLFNSEYSLCLCKPVEEIKK